MTTRCTPSSSQLRNVALRLWGSSTRSSTTIRLPSRALATLLKRSSLLSVTTVRPSYAILRFELRKTYESRGDFPRVAAHLRQRWLQFAGSAVVGAVRGSFAEASAGENGRGVVSFRGSICCERGVWAHCPQRPNEKARENRAHGLPGVNSTAAYFRPSSACLAAIVSARRSRASKCSCLGWPLQMTGSRVSTLRLGARFSTFSMGLPLQP